VGRCVKIISLIIGLSVLLIIEPYLVHAYVDPNQDDDIYIPLVMNGNSNPTPPEEMVSITAGNFPMGCDLDHNGGYSCYSNELPLHTVYLDAYFIDKYEVTNDQMAAFLNSRGSNDCDGFECIDLDDPDRRISWNGSNYVIESGYSDHPVIEVTWYGANVYCIENGKRLPTEAEWEKAARGTSLRSYPWGDSDPTCSLANFEFFDGSTWKFCVGNTTPVGNYPLGASPFGVLDMAGNVAEWVDDWYLSSYYSSSPYSNPPGPETGSYKVLRGGGWSGRYIGLRTANRDFWEPNESFNNFGFRCVVESSKLNSEK